MRVLLTGATGFVGLHVARCLLAHDGEVAAVVRPESNAWRITDILPRLHVIHGDISHMSAMTNEICAFAPDVTVHLAWRGVEKNDRNDSAQIANLYATLNLLEVVHAAGCEVWVGLGSQAEYGICDRAIAENMPAHPESMYGVTKLSTCLLTRQLCKFHNIRFVWLRLFSTYGPGDDPTCMIPYVVMSLLRGECPALTPGEQKWDYLFVQDVAEAVYSVASKPDVQGIFNLGSGETHTVREVAEQIRDLINPNLPLGFGQVPYRPNQIMHLQADISRLRQATVWVPRVSLRDGLEATIAWYRSRTNQREENNK